jgi:hypothetical protein
MAAAGFGMAAASAAARAGAEPLPVVADDALPFRFGIPVTDDDSLGRAA